MNLLTGASLLALAKSIYLPLNTVRIYDITLSAFKNKKLELFPIVAVDMFLRSSLSVNHINEVGCSLLLSKRGSVNLFIILNFSWKAVYLKF